MLSRHDGNNNSALKTFGLTSQRLNKNFKKNNNMKKIYSKPETEIIDLEPQQMICQSTWGDEPTEDDEWFEPATIEETNKSFKGVLD